MNRIFWLVALSMVLASCAAPMAGIDPVVTPTPKTLEGDEALRRDAETMARSLGISVDEAIRRLQQQDDIGKLGAELESQEAGTFAGLWIQQTPTYRVVVAFTRDGEKTIRRHIANTPLASVIEVRAAQATLAELETAQQRVIALMESLDLAVSSAINVQENQVELYVTDRSQFDTTLEKAKAQLPDHVVAITIYEPLRDKIPFPLTPDPTIHSPQLKTRSADFMTALAIGKLVVKDGCLRIGEGDSSYLILWQPDYFVNNDDGVIEVLDRNGQVVARVGEEIRMGGGEVPLTVELERQLREPLPKECPGPYWLMGQLASRN
jgi:hypothetical protein